MRFDDYPYLHGRRYFQTEPTADKPVAFDLSLAVGRIEHDLWSVDLAGTIRWASGCDFHLEVAQYMEDVDEGTDRLTLQQYALSFGPRGHPRSYQVSFGFGIAVLDGESTSDVGPLIQAEMVNFFRRPLSLKFHAGFMAFRDATVTDLRAEIGFHWDRFAVTAGIRSLISSGGEDLTGPTLGLTVFF